MYFDSTPKFTIPEFILCCGDDILSRHPEQGGCFKGRDVACYLAHSNVHPDVVVTEYGNNTIILLGSPVYDNKLNREKLIATVDPEGNIQPHKIAQINGEFLLIVFNRENDSLTIANDRFTSFPLYYYHDKTTGSVALSPYFSSIWSYLKESHTSVKLDQNGLTEFIFFQRLLGSRTYLEEVHFLPDASIITFTGTKATINRYWQRNYTKNTNSLSDNAHMLAELIKQSLRRKSSDNRRYGHFLSGGMDSRSILAAFEDTPPVCFTATLSENREFKTAQKLAETKKAKHIFLRLGENHYSDIYEASTRITGGMYNYDHGLFLGYNSAVTEFADVCFHGHGFDYMFQGMYIPAKRVKLFGRNLYMRKMVQLPEDLISFFIHNISYRIKNADIASFAKNGMQEITYDSLKTSLLPILDQAKNLTDIPNDQWEYLTFHHLSRHYSFPNHASVASFVEQRTVAFDNDIFNLYCSLPIDQRFDGRIEKECLKLLDPQLAKIWSANTNLPITASCTTQTAYQLAGFIKRHIFPEEQIPSWKERTWPSREYVLRNQTTLKRALKNLLSSGVFEQIEFLDMEKLNNDISEWLDGNEKRGVSGDFVQTLLTLGTFLKQN